MSAIDADLERRILFEDNHLLAINKKAGEIIQGDKTGDEALNERIKKFLQKKYNKPGDAFLGIVHRLDRPTSGVVIFAKTSKGASRLSAQFREKEISKTYWAITSVKPQSDSGTLQHYLKKNPKNNKSSARPLPSDDRKQAVLDYELIKESDRYFLLEVKPVTGRHHQIRVQLAAEGMPIKGDLKYGFDRSNKDGSISLHARSITFKHPTSKEEITLKAPVPEDKLWQFFEG